MRKLKSKKKYFKLLLLYLSFKKKSYCIYQTELENCIPTNNEIATEISYSQS